MVMYIPPPLKISMDHILSTMLTSDLNTLTTQVMNPMSIIVARAKKMGVEIFISGV
jgi:hypothetical protein